MTLCHEIEVLVKPFGKVHIMLREEHFARLTLPVPVLIAIACGLLSTGCTAPTPPPPQVGVTDVDMRNIAFSPNEVTIQQGETVRWTNLETFIPHTVTSGNPGDADAGALFDSGNMASGDSFSHQFDQAGTFIYFCEIHPGIMVNAKVIVLPPP